MISLEKKDCILIYSLCYISTKSKGLTNSDTKDILEKSSANNKNKMISGVLINYKKFDLTIEEDPVLFFELFDQIKK